MNGHGQDAAIQVDRLTRNFGDLAAVDNISLAVNKGEIYGLVGPDGAGKTTTLRMLAGLLDPSAGRVRVAGCDLPGQSDAVKTHLAYMSQRFGLYPDLTVSENINFYGGIYGLVGQRLTERSAWAIHMAGLQGRENQFTRLLTGGWKQRLALACAILHRPPITFIVPARYFIALLRGIFLKGIGLEVLGLNAALLTLYAAVMMILAHRKMKLKLEG